jgi:hypothetical protein
MAANNVELLGPIYRVIRLEIFASREKAIESVMSALAELVSD